MAETEFNLLTEPWILVMEEDCTVREVSLTDALLHAHEYRELAGELPTQDAAILRLLLAVLHAVFERVDAEGNKAEIETADDALDRWADLWQRGRFPEEPLLEYLESQRDNFWLFHPTKPFWQADQIAESASTQSEPIRKINGAISESGNKVRLFAERSGAQKDSLSCAEAARWLICMNQYDDNTLKTGLGVAWLGNFAAIISKGENLFQTLILNFVLLDHTGEVWDIGAASWEKRWKQTETVQKIALPHNPVAILSSHSRFGRFVRENEIISKYKSAKGGVCFAEITYDEQMAIWKKDAKRDTYYAIRSMGGKQMWREFPSIIAEQDGKSGLVRWHNKLLHEGCIERASLLRYEIVNIDYDTSQHSSVDNIYSDSLVLHANLLSLLSDSCRTQISNEILRCGKIADCIGMLANDLFISAGGDTKKSSASVEAAKTQFYYEIDIPFRRWLASLDADAPNWEEKIRSWRKEAEYITYRLAEKMEHDAGQVAFVGKAVNGKYYSTSIAMQWFRVKMSRI